MAGSRARVYGTRGRAGVPAMGGVLAMIVILACAGPVTAQQGTEEEMEPQFPQQQSADDMLKACASSRLTRTGRERKRYCAGFVSGVEEAMRLLRLDDKTQRPFCTPENVTASALADAFVKYGAGHKGELQAPAARVVMHALESAYPCPGAR